MGAMASQITSLRIVYSTVYSGADQRKHQSSASLVFVRGIHRWPVNSPHKWPVTRKKFQLVTSSCHMVPQGATPYTVKQDKTKCILHGPYFIQCGAVITRPILSTILAWTHHSLPVKARYGASFVDSISELCPVTAVMHAISCYIGLRYNGTRLYCRVIYRSPLPKRYIIRIKFTMQLERVRLESMGYGS